MCIVLVICKASARNLKTYRKGQGESAHAQTHLGLCYWYTQSTEVEKGSDRNLEPHWIHVHQNGR